MNSSRLTKVLVIGVGNAYRGDDAVGPLVSRRIKELAPEGVEAREHSGEGASLMEDWSDATHVYIVDAVYSGAAPGRIFRFDATNEKIPSNFFHYSSHDFSVAEAVEISRVLGRLPQHLVIYGIEGKDFAPGIEISAEVREAADDVVRRILSELEKEL